MPNFQKVKWLVWSLLKDGLLDRNDRFRDHVGSSISLSWIQYDSTYPLTKPKSNVVDHRTIYKIGVIADPDQASVRDGTKKLFSELLTGQNSIIQWVIQGINRTVESEIWILHRYIEFTGRQRRSHFWERLYWTRIGLLVLWSWNGAIGYSSLWWCSDHGWW